ncbi:amino acid permease [Candidatus Woesearchaeota archaeon]|nr:amino acid permease [Candidatus Woesearchaeota archaeon]
MKNKTGHFKLKKELNLFSMTLYGVGIILGAGIYALIGVGAGIAGNMLWFSFILAAFLAIFSGLSYAELSGMFPKEAAEYNYTKKAFNKETLSFIVGWILVIASIIAAATVSLGFAGYFSHIFGGGIKLIAIGLIIILSLINYIGIKSSAKFNNIASLIEVSGLLLVVVIGIFFFNDIDVNFFEMPPGGIPAIITTVALIFFAYIGFEDIVNVSEEVKNAKKVVPKALVYSLIISTVLYILVSTIAIGVVGWEKLASSKAPLTEVVSMKIPQAGVLMSIIALFATSNTVLILLIVGSRVLYGMSKQKTLPKSFAKIGRTGTPYIGVILVALTTIIAASFGNLGFVASLTDLGIFIAYFFVNMSLLKLRYSKTKYKRTFKSPSIGNFPILAVLGAITCVIMFFYFELKVWLVEIGALLVGFLIYKFYNKK